MSALRARALPDRRLSVLVTAKPTDAARDSAQHPQHCLVTPRVILVMSGYASASQP